MLMFPCLNLSLACTTTARLSPEEQEKKIRLCFFNALDVRVEFAQFFIEMFVAAVDVIDATHFCNAVCFQSRKHQRGGGAQIARHHWSAKEMIDALDHRSRAFKIDMCAHPLYLSDMHVPLRKSTLCHDADAAAW